MKSLVRNFAVFVAALLVVFATNMAYRSVRAADSAADAVTYLVMVKNRAGNPSFAVDKIIGSYHATVNGIFNNAFSQLVKEKDSNKLLGLVKTPPEVIDDQKNPTGVRHPCLDDNLSTYCIAQKGVKEFLEFREAMVYATTLADQVTVQARGDISIGEKGITEFNSFRNKIDDEINFAQQALDQGLSAYNEFQMALPLHRKYQEIIGSLEAYRDAAAAIRKEVELYPATFLDVTTTACT